MDLSTITTAQFVSQFPRNFPYQPACPTLPACEYVQNSDIQNAFNEAQMIFNQALFDCPNDITLAYLYLSAHYLQNDIQAQQAGLNSVGAFPVASRSVGSVSETYMIPDAYKDNPNLAQYTSTAYGMKYLSFILPKLIGNIQNIAGGVSPNSDGGSYGGYDYNLANE